MREGELDKLRQVAETDGRYALDGFLFMLEALEYCLARLDKRRHVTGQELSLASRDLARERYGMLALPVLRQWGITGTADFGEIVYLLIRAGQMKKAAEDSLDDFHGVFDFTEAFARDFPIPLPE